MAPAYAKQNLRVLPCHRQGCENANVSLTSRASRNRNGQTAGHKVNKGVGLCA